MVSGREAEAEAADAAADAAAAGDDETDMGNDTIMNIYTLLLLLYQIKYLE